MSRRGEIGSVLLIVTTLGCGLPKGAMEVDARVGEDPARVADAGADAQIEADAPDAAPDGADTQVGATDAADGQPPDGGADAAAPGCDAVECELDACCVTGCGGPDVGGTCVSARDECGVELVCGCDGVTYGAACLAHASCVAIAHVGACDETDCDREPVADNGLCPRGTFLCALGPEQACIPDLQFGSCCGL